MENQEYRLQDTSRISSTLIIPGKVYNAQCWVPHTVKVGIQKKTVEGEIPGMTKGELKVDLQAKTAGLNQIKSREEKIKEQE